MSFENGKVCRVVLRATAGTYEHVNVLHYDLNDAGLSTGTNNPQTLADFFRDNVQGVYTQLFTSNWTIDPIKVEEEIDPLDKFAPRSSWLSGTSRPGTKVITGDQLPAGLVVLVALKSNTLGRRYNGRMWLGGPTSEADQINGQWQSSLLSVCSEIVANIPRQPDISEGPSGASCDWSIYSRTARAQSSGHYLAHGITPTVSDRVHWLRSRSVFRS